MLEAEDLGVDLLACLDRITPVDEECRLVLKDRDHTGRAGEAAYPRQAIGLRRHVLALMFVGARNEETLEPARFQLGAQGRHTGRRRALVRR